MRTREGRRSKLSALASQPEPDVDAARRVNELRLLGAETLDTHTDTDVQADTHACTYTPHMQEREATTCTHREATTWTNGSDL